MSTRRTTLTADETDLAVLKEEARRRGVSLARLLGEVIGKEAAAIRAAHRPRWGVVDRPVSIAEATEGDPEGPGRSEFRSSQ